MNNMSWDISEYDIECRCGKGLIHVVLGSNDFGETNRRETILCEECRKAEEERERIYDEKRELSKRQINNVMSYFREHYEQLWRKQFEDAKTKKSFWEIATRLKLESSSIGTVYSKWKSSDEYVTNFIRWENIDKLVVALGISDKQLQDLVNESKPLHDELHNIWLAQAYHDLTGK